MNLRIIRNKDNLKRTTSLIVVDVDNFYLPCSPINNFLLERKLSLSVNRIEIYANALIKFFRWLDKQKVIYKNVTQKDLTDYRDYMLVEPDQRYTLSKILIDSNNISGIHQDTKCVETINQHLDVLRLYYEFLCQRYEIQINPCPELRITNKQSYSNIGMLAHVKKNKMVVNPLKLNNNVYGNISSEYEISEYLEEQETKSCAPFSQAELKNIMNNLKNPQEVLLTCMLLLGLRISDALGRRINDIKWSGKIIKVIKRDDDPPDGVVKYGSYRDVPITGVLFFQNLPEVMYEAYKGYVQDILRPKQKLNTHNYLFITTRGQVNPLSYDNIYRRVMHENLQKIITNREIGFHSFRHFYATSNIAMGVKIESVQKILGHRHISTTIEDYYNPTISFIKELVSLGILKAETADERVKEIFDYKKRFCKK
jgi:site-specific recombinase XerD